jgi:hypothetical protein
LTILSCLFHYILLTLTTINSGSILEFTYIGGPVPSLATAHGQVFHLGSQRPMHGSWQTHPGNGTNRLYPFGEPQGHPYQWVNAYHQLLPYLGQPRGKTGSDGRAMPRAASPPPAEHSVLGHTRAMKSPVATCHHCW